MGALAGLLSVSGLAEALGANPRTMHNWATNKSAMPAVAAGLLADLAKTHRVAPMLYTHPNLANGYVASTPDGWVMWTWGTWGTWGIGPYGYPNRRRYMGHTKGLIPAGSEVLCLARTHGWHW